MDLIESARVEVEQLRHKAEQYDSLVAALSVADGGRYRADTVETVLHRLRQKEEAIKKALAFHDRYCDRVGAADGWARAVHQALRDALGETS